MVTYTGPLEKTALTTRTVSSGTGSTEPGCRHVGKGSRRSRFLSVKTNDLTNSSAVSRVMENYITSVPQDLYACLGLWSGQQSVGVFNEEAAAKRR